MKGSQSRTPSPREKLAEIYRQAAKYFEESKGGSCEFVCEAIGEVMELHRFAHVEDHPALQLFMPPKLDNGGGFWNHRTKGPRILALCFMAAMVEAGDV